MFTKKLTDIRTKALNYIKSVVEYRGDDYQLIDPQSIEDELPDEFYELPRGFHVSKHGFYDEYPIITINIKDGELEFVGSCGLGETENDYSFTEEDLFTDAICEIADLVNKLEND